MGICGFFYDGGLTRWFALEAEQGAEDTMLGSCAAGASIQGQINRIRQRFVRGCQWPNARRVSCGVATLHTQKVKVIDAASGTVVAASGLLRG